MHVNDPKQNIPVCPFWRIKNKGDANETRE